MDRAHHQTIVRRALLGAGLCILTLMLSVCALSPHATPGERSWLIFVATIIFVIAIYELVKIHQLQQREHPAWLNEQLDKPLPRTK